MGEGPGSTRRAMMSRSLLVAAVAGAAPAAGQPQAAPTRSLDVRDFGAAGDGVTDDTEAFNRATRASADWSEDLACAIRVPAGRYLIKGTVFLRKGQSLIGEGLASCIDARGSGVSTFVLGRRRSGSGRGVEDPGGAPIRVQDLSTLGGAADQGLFYVTAQGFQLHGLFLSASGLGIEIEGSGDGSLSDIVIDQCLTGILLRASQNIILSNLNVYLPNYGVTLAERCHDIVLASSIFCYTRHCSILLADGAHSIAAVAINNCIFTSNASADTFGGYVRSRASNGELLISNCVFRNAPGYAVMQDSGVGMDIALRGCVIDGARSDPGYDQSAGAKGLLCTNGRFTLTDCTFRNLAGEVFRLAAGTADIALRGGSIERVAGEAMIVAGGAKGRIRLRQVEGLGELLSERAAHRLLLPALGGGAIWRATVIPRGGAESGRAASYMIRSGARPQVERLWGGGAAEAAAMPSARLTADLLEVSLPTALVGAEPPLLELQADA